MKKILTLTRCLALLLGLFSGCGGKQYDPLAGVETTVFTDDAGQGRERGVEGNGLFHNRTS